MKPRVLLCLSVSVHASRPTTVPNQFLSLRRRVGSSWYFGSLFTLSVACFTATVQLKTGWVLMAVVPLLMCFLGAQRKWESASLREILYVPIPVPDGEVGTVVRNVKRLDAPCGHTYRVGEWEYRAYDNTYVAKGYGTLQEHPKAGPHDDLEELVKRHVATEYRQHGWGSYPRLQDQKPYRDPASTSASD